MTSLVAGGPFWRAVVIDGDAAVDEVLLDAVAAETGLQFSEVGSGGFGGEVLAAVYADGSGENLLILAEAFEVGIRAVIVQAESDQTATAVRDAVGGRLGGWTEPALRDRMEAAPEDVRLLVPLMMATGGAQPDPGTRALLGRALEHEDPDVREAAEYAARVAEELGHPPMVLGSAPQQELPEVLRPAVPVAGDETWVTVRAGVPDRVVAGPVTWMRAPDTGIDLEMADLGWSYEVTGQPESGWCEDIYAAPDGRTAAHSVEHRDGIYVALHGADVEQIAAMLTEAGAESLAGPPELTVG